MTDAPRLHILLNPVSGPLRSRGADWEWLAERARAAGWEVRSFVSMAPGDLTRLAAEAREAGARRVVVVGGDGSINEAIQPLVDSPVEVAVIPAGTSNVLAYELGIPPEPRAAGEIAVAGQVGEMDAGKANGRYFSLMLGVGYDAATSLLIWPELKKRIGQMAYGVAGFQSFLQHRATRMRIQVDHGRKLRRLVYMLVVANTRLYGMNNAMVAEHADVRDGRFDLCIFRTRKWYHVVLSFIRIVTRRARRFPLLETMHCQHVSIRSARPVPYQLDGDVVGTLPVEVEICPRALKIVLPRV